MSGKQAAPAKRYPIVALTHETFVAALLLITGGAWLALAFQVRPSEQ